MGLLAYPKRTGFLFSHKSLTLFGDAADIFEGVLSFKFDPKIDGRTLLYGTGPIALGRSKGNLSIETEVKFAAEKGYKFIRENPNYLFAEFNWTASFEDGDQRATIELISLTFEDTDAPSEGTDPNEMTFKGTAIDLKMDGVSVADSDA